MLLMKILWHKIKGLNIDLCPVSKSTKNFTVSAKKFIKTVFQGSDHNILVIHFEVNLSSTWLNVSKSNQQQFKKS